MDNKFEYTYSAPRNAEVERIRKKYAPKTSAQSKLEQIRMMDRRVESEAVGFALDIGITGALVLGLGMCCCMVWTELFVLGIIVGIIGIAVCGAAYPLYTSKLKKKRAEIAPQILKLTEELENLR